MSYYIYNVTNGCGYSDTTRYRNYSELVQNNADCFEQASDKERNRTIRVYTGTKFCNKVCKAQAQNEDAPTA
jgi:hypothetical protein